MWAYRISPELQMTPGRGTGRGATVRGPQWNPAHTEQELQQKRTTLYTIRLA